MKRGRESNWELYRIICMLFIIAGHFIMNHPSEIGNMNYYIGNFFRSYTMVAVNCFVLLSGFFGLSFNRKKLLKLNFQVLFYSVAILISATFIVIYSFNFKQDILLFIPILTKRYWFITTYFVLCMLSPFLNVFIQNINKYQYQKLLVLLVSLFYIWPTLMYPINAPTITNDAGYGIINFVCLYVIGRYINLYFKDNININLYFIGFLLFGLLSFLANDILTKIFVFYFNSFISYDTIFVLGASIMLFMFFKKLELKSQFINGLAEYSLAVYIIHMHPAFMKYLFNDLIKVSNYNGIYYIVGLMIIPIVIYLLCWIIEFIRVKLFGKFEDSLIDKIEFISSKISETKIIQKSFN